MTDHRRSHLWWIVLFWVAVGCFVLSMPCFLASLLGLLGVLADAGPADNRRMGLQLLRMAAIPLSVGLVVLLVALVVRRSRRQ